MPCVNIIFSLLCLFGLFLKKKKKNDHYKQSLPLLKKTQKKEQERKRKKRKIKAGRYRRKTLNHNYPLN